MKSCVKIKDMVWTIWLSIATLLVTGAVWIRKTYGTFIYAMADESFRNGLSNKRILCLKYVILPTLIVFLVSLVVNRILKKSFRRIIVYAMGVLAVLSVCMAAIILDLGSYVSRQHRISQEQWYDIDNLIIHAFGNIDDTCYTNSKEALENSYQNGNKLLECDLILTSDGKIVACHDWVFWNENVDVEEMNGVGQNESYVPTLDVFMSTKLMGKYTPLSGTDILLFLKEHPDTYMITDTKYWEPDDVKAQFQELLNEARECDCEDVLDRVVVQIYQGYMLGFVDEIYPFPNYIFTLYREDFTGEEDKMREYVDFCVDCDVDVITMYAKYYHDELLDICDQYDIRLFVHTVNDKDEIDAFHEKGVGVYTDNVERDM